LRELQQNKLDSKEEAADTDKPVSSFYDEAKIGKKERRFPVDKKVISNILFLKFMISWLKFIKNLQFKVKIYWQYQTVDKTYVILSGFI
jgi:hypothetical protein